MHLFLVLITRDSEMKLVSCSSHDHALCGLIKQTWEEINMTNYVYGLMDRGAMI